MPSPSAAVAQARGDAVDREMNRALGARVGIARAVALEQLDLKMVERIEIGKAAAYRARERRVVRQQLLAPGDFREPAPGAMPFDRDVAEHARAKPGVGHQLGVAR